MGKHRRLQTVQCRRHEPRRNHRDPGGPITGAGRAVTGDGMVSAGFVSGRNGDCSSSSASAPISVSVIASLRPHRNHLRHHGRWKIGLQLLDGDLFGELLWVVLNLDDVRERIVLYRIHLARVVVAGPVGALFGAGAPEGRPARSWLRPGSPCRTRGSEPMALRRDAGMDRRSAI